MQKPALLPLLLLGALSVFWGLNWPGMKIILAEVPVWWFRASCLIVGGSILLTISALSGNRWRIHRSEWRSVATCACFAIMGWMVFSAYGVQLMPAGRASIVAFTMPLWATIFSAILLSEKITRAKVAGLLIGITGLGFLIGPDLVVLKRAPTGALFMLAAAVSWGFGTVLLKSIKWSLPVITNIAWQLLFSAVPILIVAVLVEPFPAVTTLSPRATIALIYIYLFPMTFCQWAYFKTVQLLPASIAAIGTLLVPVVGVYSSHLILAEPVGFNELVALILIVVALALVILAPAFASERLKESESD